MKKYLLSLNVTGVAMLFCATANASCGSAFCTINSNWDEHSPGHHGWSADIHYSYIHADQLRSGKESISADTGAVGEVENIGTTNRITTLALDYSFNDAWAAKLIMPFIDRKHAHNIGPYSGTTPADYESFHAKALGDIKLVGRYRWSLNSADNSGMGIKFGLKMNTGKKDLTINQTGEVPEEVTLQPGNGSSDLILGLFWYQSPPNSDWSWFSQATVQSSIKSQDNFTPGNQINVDVGARYAMSHNISALLQINAQWNATDSGDNAALTEDGEASSGGKTYSLSPGLSYAISRNTQYYALAQLPFYQYVNGEQLTADSSFTVGASHRF